MTIHLNLDQGQIRWYSEKEDPESLFARRADFQAEADIKILSDNSVFMWAHRGHMEKQDYVDLGIFLASKGFKYVLYEKRGKLIVQQTNSYDKTVIE